MVTAVVRVPPLGPIDPELAQIDAWEAGLFHPKVALAPLLYVEIAKNAPPWWEGHILHVVVEQKARSSTWGDPDRKVSVTACYRQTQRQATSLAKLNGRFNYRSYRWRLCKQCLDGLGGRRGVR